MSTWVIVKEIEARLREYEKEQNFLNDAVNKLFMENMKLKEQLKGAGPSQKKEIMLD